MRMNNIPILERPRERLLKKGAGNLSNEDLLTIILKTGTKEKSVQELSLELLSKLDSFFALKEVTVNFLRQIKGIGKVKAIELVAAIEIGRRLNDKSLTINMKISSSLKVFEYFGFLYNEYSQEVFGVICLDNKNKVINHKELFKGTLNTSTIHPREIFKYAILNSSSKIICLHNHPSGDVNPSLADKELTKILKEVGKIMGIPLIDHIIIGENKFYSFFEQKVIKAF